MELMVAGFGRIGASTYDEGAGGMFFIDNPDSRAPRDQAVSREGGLYRLRDDGTAEFVVAGLQGGGVAFNEDGRLVVVGPTVSLVDLESGATETVLDDLPVAATSFSDLTVDPDGRLYVGSAFWLPEALSVNLASMHLSTGCLHLIDTTGESRILSWGIAVSNGIGVSPDGKTVYQAETGKRRLLAYDREDDGSVGERRVLHQWDDGLPDGLWLAEDGNVWLAMGQVGFVSVVSPQGFEVDRLEVPHPRLTNVCFGGPHRRTVYITAGTDELTGAPAAIYAHEVAVAGVPRPRARLDLKKNARPS